MNTRELKWQSLWQANAKYLQKWHLLCSPHVSVEPTTERSSIIEMEENLTALLFLLSDDIDIETTKVFQNIHLGGTDQKSRSFWPAERLTKNWC